MTFYSSSCGDCGRHCEWTPHRVGGRWTHRDDTDHDPVIDWEPIQVRNVYGDWTTR